MAVCCQHAVGINNSRAFASKETGPFIATNGFIFVFDGGGGMMLLCTEAAESADGNSTGLASRLRYGICIMHKARNASLCMINKKRKHGTGG